ncbi:hypothetical protein K3725_00430 [Leisingera sp. S132]|uniref:hypothetical protein n=1 Tax=Leisingera sp. S132 TaxID=2867016 RepID=UPI0021A6B320|nr:hypothetical protein [Leisingera sp. S132]UWQ79510.1 hypothetical protein K3725_00430 [Leisingera sp. S132]
MEAEFYLPNDDCANGASCPGEGVFIPQQIGNTALDALFAGSDADVQADLGLANVDSYPLTDEVFPVILDAALLTLDGLMDCFARKYPERAQLLNALIETQGYRITFEENPTAAEAELETWLQNYGAMVRRQTRNAATNEDYALLNEMRDAYAREQRRLNAMRHWHFAPGEIYLSTRINRNIDVNNFLLGDDEDLINRAATNEEGADWLNAVMGDWMVRSGIPGATRDEEFTDSFSSRITWGTLNVVFGAAEVIGGVALTVGTLGWGTVAGGALSIAGFEAITQGIDMWRTPVESSHSAGWLGDGAFAMMNEFGVLEQNDQTSFNRYWSFAMLGLSLGGAGVLGFAGDVVQANRAGMAARNLDFVAEAPARALATARQAIVGVKNARFGQLTVSYAPLPSGRIAMNVQGVGRIVAPHWESLTRLRLRMNTTKREFVQERASKLQAGEAGLIALRGGVLNLNDAKQLVYQTAAHMGMSQRMTDQLISAISFGGRTSSFNARGALRVATDIGYARNLGRQPMVDFNEFIAMNEIFHELTHAQRLSAWLRTGKSPEEYWRVFGAQSPLNKAEEVSVELAAREWTEQIARPRIAQEQLYGSSAEAARLQQLLNEALDDSRAYVSANGGIE